MIEHITNPKLVADIYKTMVDGLSRLNHEIHQIEEGLSVPVLEDSHAILLHDLTRPESIGQIWVFGEWENKTRGFKHLSQVPWHNCGTIGYSRKNAFTNVDKLTKAETRIGMSYSYVHFRELKKMILTEKQKSQKIATDFIAEAEAKFPELKK